jgi:chaperonin GroEL
VVKKYASSQELQRKLHNGVNILADNVAVTLGPRGRNVLLAKKDSPPVITKDGVTVANFVDFEDPFENAAAQLLKQVASETNTLAGDGTTTSTVLARDIFNNAQKYITAGSSPIELKRGMDKATLEIVKKIDSLSQEVCSEEEIRHVATVSANGETALGELITTAVSQAGHDGAILIEEAKSTETKLDVVEGFRFDSGYFAQAFVNNERRNTIEYEDVLVLVTDYKIDSVQEILPILELVARESKPFIIVAEEVEGQALAALIMNTVRGSMKVAAIRAPRYGKERRQIMEDLCFSVGAAFVSRSSGKSLSDVKLVDLGTCKKVEVLKNYTTIMGGNANWERIDSRIDSLKSEIKQTEDMDECRRLQERITRLVSGVSIIKVGGVTEVEMTEKRHRIEDALEAVKAAQEEGIVAGGGVTLLRCKEFEIDSENEDQAYGANIIRKSLEAPLRQMARNSGESEDMIINYVEAEPDAHGYDFRKRKIINMFKGGIVDPAKVTRVALQNAVSVVSTLITTSNAIIKEN